MSTSKATTTRGADSAPIPAGGVAAMRRRPTHPGAIFREYREAQEPHISQADAARRLGWSTNRMNEFEVGKRGVTVENAAALARLTHTSPEFWLQLQANVDLWDGIQKAKNVKVVLAGEPFPVAKHR